MERIYAFAISLALLVATPGLATADTYTRPAGNQQAIDYVIARGLSQRGIPYTYGGGNAAGPTRGTEQQDVSIVGVDPRANIVGFDASGLMLYAFAGVGIKLPRSSGEQYKVGRKIAPTQALPGDLIFFGPEGSHKRRDVPGKRADAGGHRSRRHGFAGPHRQHDSILDPDHRVMIVS